MNFLRRKTTWTNFEFGIIKICLVSLGISLGIWLNKTLAAYETYFIITYAVTALFGIYFWITKMRSND